MNREKGKQIYLVGLLVTLKMNNVDKSNFYPFSLVLFSHFFPREQNWQVRPTVLLKIRLFTIMKYTLHAKQHILLLS